MAAYDKKEDWEQRLRRRFNTASGYEELGPHYNIWLYRARVRTLKAVWRSLGITVNERTRVLEVGCGSGFWVGFFAGLGVRDLSGIDITDISVEVLKQRFPQCCFLKKDISSPDFDLGRKFDLITVFDMLWYLDEQEFPRAIANLAHACTPGAYVFMTDILSEGPVPQYVGFWARGLADYRKACEENGLKILGVHPIFFFMNTPADYHVFRSSLMRRLHERGWRALKGCLERFSGAGVLLGPILYWVDGVAARMYTRSPSTKLLFCQRERGEE